jgi:hypothetical protein
VIAHGVLFPEYGGNLLVLQKPDDEQIDLAVNPVADLLDDDEFTDVDPYGEPHVELTELPGWVRALIIIVVVAMVLSVTWWIVPALR